MFQSRAEAFGPASTWTSRLFRRFLPARSSSSRPRAATRVTAVVEHLESKRMLTAYVVDTLIDGTADDGDISLREALEAAGTNVAVGDAPAGESDAIDTITFSDEILALASATITLTDGELSIDDGQLVLDGGGVVTIDADGQSRIFADTHADGVVVLNNITLTGGLVDGDGGAIEKSGVGTLALTRVTGTNNTAVNGGFISVTDGRVIVRGGAYQNNTANGDDAGTVGGLGGAFHFVGGGDEVRNNQSDSELLSHAIIGAEISSNTATGQGGGVFHSAVNAQTPGSLRIVSSTIQSNVAGTDTEALPGEGGGIAVTGGGTLLRVIDSTISSNTAETSGGGLWVDDGAEVAVAASADGATSTVSQNVANGTESTQGGGGIFSNEASVAIHRAVVESNTASNGNAAGGGIHIVTGEAVILNSSVTGNTAGGSGGGVVVRGGDVVFSGTTVGGANNGGNQAADGAGIAVTETPAFDNRVAILGGDVVGNTATNEGGGIRVAAGERLVVIEATIDANSAVDGGGLYNAGGAVVIRESVVSSNAATNNGGGLLNEANGTLFITARVDATADQRSSLSSNTAGVNGGGFFNAGDARIVRTDVDSNEADSDDDDNGEGGGLFTETGTTTLVHQSTLTNNTGTNGAADETAGGGTVTQTG